MSQLTAWANKCRLRVVWRVLPRRQHGKHCSNVIFVLLSWEKYVFDETNNARWHSKEKVCITDHIFQNKWKSLLISIPIPQPFRWFYLQPPCFCIHSSQDTCCSQNSLHLKGLGWEWGLLCSWFSANLTLKQSLKKLRLSCSELRGRIVKWNREEMEMAASHFLPKSLAHTFGFIREAGLEFLNGSRYPLDYPREQWSWPFCTAQHEMQKEPRVPPHSQSSRSQRPWPPSPCPSKLR